MQLVLKLFSGLDKISELCDLDFPDRIRMAAAKVVRTFIGDGALSDKSEDSVNSVGIPVNGFWMTNMYYNLCNST